MAAACSKPPASTPAIATDSLPPECFTSRRHRSRRISHLGSQARISAPPERLEASDRPTSSAQPRRLASSVERSCAFSKPIARSSVCRPALARDCCKIRHEGAGKREEGAARQTCCRANDLPGERHKLRQAALCHKALGRRARTGLAVAASRPLSQANLHKPFAPGCAMALSERQNKEAPIKREAA